MTKTVKCHLGFHDFVSVGDGPRGGDIRMCSRQGCLMAIRVIGGVGGVWVDKLHLKNVSIEEAGEANEGGRYE